MKKLFYSVMLLAMAMAVPAPIMAAVDISVNISLPPAIEFSSPPDVIVMPDTTDVYLVPDIDADLFFWNGWWWYLWEGRWYRSHYYDRGWGYYSSVPSFYYDVDPGWRGYYRDRNWYGHQWNYQRIPHQRLQKNWKNWKSNRFWERQGTWGVQSYQPRPQQQRRELRQQRQQQYQQRPEVQQQRQPQAPKPQIQQPTRQPWEGAVTPQNRESIPQVRQPRQQPQEKVIQPPQKHEQKPEVKQFKPQPQEKAQKRQQESMPKVKQQQQERAQKPQHVRPREKPEKGDDDKKDRK